MLFSERFRILGWFLSKPLDRTTRVSSRFRIAAPPLRDESPPRHARSFPRNHPWTEPVNSTARQEKETVDEDVPASRCRGRRVDRVSRERAGATAREQRGPGLRARRRVFGRLWRRLCVRPSSSPLALTLIL